MKQPVLKLSSICLSLFSMMVSAQQLPDAVVHWPDTIYTNAIVVTLDDHAMNDNPGTIAQAIAVRGEEIQAIGTAGKSQAP